MLTLVVLLLLNLLGHSLGHGVNEFCDDEMTACVCPEENSECEFHLDIQRLFTFTRYAKNEPVGTGAGVYFINDLGELQPVFPNSCPTDDCTPANTVDGETFRPAIAINGRIPGPTLVVHKGQIVIIDVINQLIGESVTIHWHGIKQFNTPWMDGGGIISQCPIQPRQRFRYIFNASEAGTFWYHSHSALQRSDGAFGGLVVKERQGELEYPIDHEDHPETHTLSLFDWYREEGDNLFWKQLSGLFFFSQVEECVDRVPRSIASLVGFNAGLDGVLITPLVFWSGLINGKGKHPNVAWNNSRLSIFEVEMGVTYRFRLIGAQSEWAYRFSVDGHRMTIMATDGYLIEPVVADYVIVNTGERYDFLLTANQTGQQSYWMRAETLEADLSEELPPYPNVEDHDALAILHYSGVPPPTSQQYEDISVIGHYPKLCTEDSPCVTVNCPFPNYHPVYNTSCVNVQDFRLFQPTPSYLLPSSEYDEQYFLSFGVESPWFFGTINARSHILPTVSFQTNPDQIDNATFCNLDDTCNDGCLCTHVVDIPYNKTIRLVLTNYDNFHGAHPVHLHGYAFQVVAVGYGMYNETTGKLLRNTNEITCQQAGRFCSKHAWVNGDGPAVTIDEFTLRKDTVIVPAGGYVVIHFVSDNPGYWPIHCHIIAHQQVGMSMVLNVAQSRHNPAPEGMQSCGNFTWTVEDFIAAAQYDPDSQTAEPPPEESEVSVNCDDSDELSSEVVAVISVAGDIFTALVVVFALTVFFFIVQRKISRLHLGNKNSPKPDTVPTADTSFSSPKTGFQPRAQVGYVH